MRLPRTIDKRKALVAAIAACLLLAPPIRTTAIVLWTLANVAMALYGLAWTAVHPRVALLASRAGRWAFWLTLVSALGAVSGLDTLSAVYVSEYSNVVAPVMPVIAVALVPFLFGFFWAVGGIGAALAHLRRKSAPPQDPSRLAAAGVAAWWLTCMAAFLVSLALGVADAPGWLTALDLGSVPAISLLLSRRMARASNEPGRIVELLDRLLVRRLVWRRGTADHAIRLDLRGGALGLAAALLALFLHDIRLFHALETTTLAAYIRMDSAAASRGLTSFAGMASPRGYGPPRVVLLELDDTGRYSMLRSRSESSIQAEVIRRLAKIGVRRIVLPLPLLADLPGPADMLNPLGPQPDKAAIERSKKDLPGLIAAIRESGCVTLAVPRRTAGGFGPRSIMDEDRPGKTKDESDRSETAFRKFVAPIARAARDSGVADLEAFGSPVLTAVSTAWDRVPPLPLVLVAADSNAPLTVRYLRAGAVVDVAGHRMRTIGPKTILVAGSEPRRDRELPRVSYGALLRGEPVYTGLVGGAKDSNHGAAEWQAPEVYFKNKIVFLDSLQQARRETPSGVVSNTEAVAGATLAILRGNVVGAQPGWLRWASVLAVGVLAGILCSRKDPFEAALPAMVTGFGVLALSGAAFIRDRLFIDPVTPLAATTAAAWLTVQLTFAAQRAARDRSRALLQRFVAPQFVEQFLDNAGETLGLGGSRRQVCVLFADARKFTQFAESHSPEDVIDTVNAYMTAMTDALYRFGGVLDKYTGDGLMALFLLGGDEAEGLVQSVRAALAMRDAAKETSARLLAEGRQGLEIGMGVHYGPAVVGIVGNPVHQVNYTALGETVVVSARLQGLAGGGEVVVSEAVFNRIAGSLAAHPREPVIVKGISNPVSPYWVTAVTRPIDSPSPIAPPAARNRKAIE